MPRLFAFVCPWIDERVARDPASEVRLLSLLVQPGDTVCDIGANRGLFTYWLLKAGAQVLAFEPNPRLARVLRLRFPAEIAAGRLRLFETALGSGSGEALLHIPHDMSPLATIDGNLAHDMGGPVERVRVALTRLDAAVDSAVSFIKLDVEGYETEVLDGAASILRTSRPTLLVEAEERHRPGAVAALVRRLEPLGYEGFFRLDGVMAPMSAFDPAAHQAVEALVPDGSRPRRGALYVNNFYFANRPEIIARLKRWTA
ncbi:FkbM family methyltransferase [Xanthobacter sp. KR7-65]|uniref:FkbM family methyltransferase n=1 Tax=Xanthobacter sp. KR7-65 TaxID=3156612 RepID=UPI0032B36BF8